MNRSEHSVVGPVVMRKPVAVLVCAALLANVLAPSVVALAASPQSDPINLLIKNIQKNRDAVARHLMILNERMVNLRDLVFDLRSDIRQLQTGINMAKNTGKNYVILTENMDIIGPITLPPLRRKLSIKKAEQVLKQTMIEVDIAGDELDFLNKQERAATDIHRRQVAAANNAERLLQTIKAEKAQMGSKPKPSGGGGRRVVTGPRVAGAIAVVGVTAVLLELYESQMSARLKCEQSRARFEAAKKVAVEAMGLLGLSSEDATTYLSEYLASDPTAKPALPKFSEHESRQKFADILRKRGEEQHAIQVEQSIVRDKAIIRRVLLQAETCQRAIVE